MKMNITFTQSEKQHSEFTRAEKQYFHLLMEIVGFRYVIEVARKECNIHPKGIIKMWPITNKQFKQINLTKLINIAVLLTRKLNLTHNWSITILTLLLGIPLVRRTTNIPTFEIKEDEETITIKVNKRISTTELTEQIRQRKSLKEKLKKLPMEKISINKKNLARDLTLLEASKKLTLFDTKGKTKKSPGQIVKMLDKIDPEGKTFANITYKDVGTNTKRLKAHLDRLFHHPDILTHVIEGSTVEKWLN